MTTIVQDGVEKAPEEVISSKKKLASILKNIWFERLLILGSGLIVSFLLLAYAFIFQATFLSNGNTTSYFPWAWGAYITDSAAVYSMFYSAEAISVLAIIGCVTILVAYLPRFKQAFR